MLNKYNLWIIDVDGVVWKRLNPIPENINGIRKLISMNKAVCFITNNSTRSRRLLNRVFSDMGVRVNPKHIITSSYATAVYLKERYGTGTVYVIGEHGLVEELLHQGFLIVDEDYVMRKRVDFVVVGLDRNLTFNKLEAALNALRRGALFIATNTDSTLPVEDDRVIPGAGSIVALLSVASGREPDVIVGKPNTIMLEVAMKVTGINSKKECIVVGDRLDTDVAMANEFGVDSLLVLTGVSKLSDIEKSSIKPTYVSKTILHALKGEFEHAK